MVSLFFSWVKRTSNLILSTCISHITGTTLPQHLYHIRSRTASLYQLHCPLSTCIIYTAPTPVSPTVQDRLTVSATLALSTCIIYTASSTYTSRVIGNIAFSSSRNNGKIVSPPFTEDKFTRSPPVAQRLPTSYVKDVFPRLSHPFPIELIFG